MFYYNDIVMDDMLSSVGKNIEEMSSMEDGYTIKMRPVSNSGLYGNGIELVNSQIVSIKNGLTNFKNLTLNNCTAVEDLENKLTKEVEKIELPKDFDATNVGINVDKEDIALFKEDGDKIKTGETEKEELEDNYNIETKDLDEMISKALETSELDDFLKTKYVDLNEINNIDVEKSKLEEIDELDRVILKAINEMDYPSIDIEDIYNWGDEDDNKS